MSELERMNRHRIRVKVRADFHFDGTIIPIKLRTEDSPPFTIDQILDIRPASAIKAGGMGVRYTCRIGDKTFYLFNDRSMWFVER